MPELSLNPDLSVQFLNHYTEASNALLLLNHQNNSDRTDAISPAIGLRGSPIPGNKNSQPECSVFQKITFIFTSLLTTVKKKPT